MFPLSWIGCVRNPLNWHVYGWQVHQGVALRQGFTNGLLMYQGGRTLHWCGSMTFLELVAMHARLTHAHTHTYTHTWLKSSNYLYTHTYIQERVHEYTSCIESNTETFPFQAVNVSLFMWDLHQSILYTVYMNWIVTSRNLLPNTIEVITWLLTQRWSCG